MRILILCKRQYTNKDLLDDRFGRLRELPLGLACFGHDVNGLCLSYIGKTEGITIDRSADPENSVHWHSLNAGPLRVPGLVRFTRKAKALAHKFKPDLIWSASDSFYGIIGHYISRTCGAIHIFDLYDNFEIFSSMRIPGVMTLYRSTIRQAAGITSVSENLSEYIRDEYRCKKPILTLPNGIREGLFKPLNKLECRKQLKLPKHARIVGTAGALWENRGISTLFAAAKQLIEQSSDIHFALAGPREKNTKIPEHPRIHDLGILPLEIVPTFINALDVAVICNKDTAFGRYCFPQKAYEALACRVPVVAAKIGTMERLLSDSHDVLYEPDDVSDLMRALHQQLTKPYISTHAILTWHELARKLETFFQNTLLLKA